ncbi:Membrane-associated proteins in eicosanoid and glutathione metabolism (MAPEG) [uncultured Sphingopyxis sp.]|uniref:Membrane-associated proteins in eicosanoid and glutathione metabolism (MAPEG) n=1 Tax=uncultured Sphingopyxis sp. TaxID=310581 RepID=A0A1Y5PXY2_9SPHN|nr:MAPEG family protein [uncultured Sphingopyxis sp.]SBV33445.1 Membrane-associated proteins in eicosanoid and glutathione metabolism (MAPEG) [uncultured Sphingopyxis sp.]
MIILPISLTIAAGAALLNLWLALRVGRVRTKEKVFIGDGGNDLLTRRMRAHSNFVENTAFVLILLALVELGLGSSMWLWGVGALYLVARILHALGMDGMLWGRMVGTIVTMLTQLGLALGALAIVYLTPTGVTTTAIETVAATPR